ncbi:hypothetical protein LJR219_004597 [Phenylobacterium sp. LjRoot219]|uniref:hypothetical protein n=1 Tax=Phenylobacterium sp. LjRoot219 TaxID=3342283 RepID=UPI003ECFEF25
MSRTPDDPVEAFGRSVLGPVFGEFALRLHLFLLAREPGETATLLFCARGGFRLRLIYQAFLEAAELPCPVPCADLMVSRLVAARTALANGSAAAYEELGREFAGDTLGGVVRALTQRDLLLDAAADTPFTPRALAELLAEESARGRMLRAELAEQNRLFQQHLTTVAGATCSVLLCDTGLYGSTVRLLRAGLPDYHWLCLLFARCNYKGFSESHFPVTVGLSVEAGGYRGFAPRTAVLRHWHLIESCLEPALPSVVAFAEHGQSARSNLERDGWQGRLEGQAGELFAGVLSYLRALPPRRAAEQIYADAPAAWQRLHDAIVWPGPKDRKILGLGERSRDFGRDETVSIVSRPGLRARLAEIKHSLWREGAVVDRFPASRWLWLGALQTGHLARGALAVARPGPAGGPD